MVSIATKTTTWKADPAHTVAEFSAKHMMITTVRGQFREVDATLHLDEDDITNSWVEATIGAGSFNTHVEMRDNHLRSADFLDVENHPTITFKSKRVERAGEDELRVIGDLTIRGVTKEVALATTYDGRNGDPWGGERIGFTATTTLNRKDFGLNWNVALETGGVLVGDKVKIDIFFEGVKQAE